jgi:hypothetical protein
MNSQQNKPFPTDNQIDVPSAVTTMLDRIVSLSLSMAVIIDTCTPNLPEKPRQLLTAALNDVLSQQEKLQELLNKKPDPESEDSVSPIVASSVALPIAYEPDDMKPKRACSAYLFYAAERRPQLKASNPELGFGELTKTIADEWKAMTDVQKQKYTAFAQLDKIRYEEERKAAGEKAGVKTEEKKAIQAEKRTVEPQVVIPHVPGLLSSEPIQLSGFDEIGYDQFCFKRMMELTANQPKLTYGELLKVVNAEWKKMSDAGKQSYADLDRSTANNPLPSLPQVPGIIPQMRPHPNPPVVQGNATFYPPRPMTSFQDLMPVARPLAPTFIQRPMPEPVKTDMDTTHWTHNGVHVRTFLQRLEQNPSLAMIIIDTAKFFADKHSISEVRNYDPTHQCDDCYSGDTEYEMNEELLKAGPILGGIYHEIVGNQDDGEEDEADEEEADEYVMP